MVKFSKKIEYSLIALRYIAGAKDEVITAKEISNKYNIPHELLAKILQKLKKENILSSNQGVNGGYKLSKPLNEISLSELIDKIEGKTAIVECLHTDNVSECFISDSCSIKDPINKMQIELENLLKTKMVSDFI
ncbi:MAG: Rrf2 family transcriptional regulator [Ignavibacteriae bacterium]|nr:Rrf2 family transcriptional regulator [Ignavibacteriota bacterium]